MSNENSIDNKGRFNYEKYTLNKNIADSIKIFKEIFERDDTIRFREFSASGIKCCAVFADGMVNSEIINSHIIRPLVTSSGVMGINELSEKIVLCNELSKSSDMSEIIESMLYGDTIIIMDGQNESLIVNTKGWQTRGISEPDDDKSLKGPREGFSESAMQNVSLLRRKLLTPELKFEFLKLGTRSGTRICICYLDSITEKNILDDLKKRLSKIEIDGIISTGNIDELIKDHPYSLFKTTGTTEKPDIAAAKLLEGRIAIIVDGTPLVMTVPYIFVENIQSPDDYYVNFYYGSVGRILRFIGFWLSISIPAIYISVVCFHQEMIPDTLLFSLMSATQGVPFPAVVECFFMLLVFEVLREAGVRMPNKVGHALSIVGALVIGQAAVEAKIASAPMVIVTAFTAIAGLMNPRITGAVIVIRFAALFASAIIGIYGYFFCMLAVLIYLCSMQSFGVPYMSQMFTYKKSKQTDIFIRVPFKFMKNRPVYIAADEVKSRK